MTTFNNLQPETVQSGWAQFIDRLNSSLHEKALWIYAFLVISHWLEHILQAFQIWGLGWARPDAKGMLGFWFPGLVTSEALHFGYALLVIGGLVLLRPGFYGRARFWWDMAFIFQAWHLFEHAILQYQAFTQHFFFGASIPTSIFQLWIPRVELHLLYNLIVTAPTVIGMIYHRYPPKGEAQHTVRCTCSVR